MKPKLKLPLPTGGDTSSAASELSATELFNVNPPNEKCQVSVWEKINEIFREAAILEELAQLRMERPGETRASALEWAKEQVKRHKQT